MHSPQAENGHIDIAHEIAEAFFKLQLSGNQWRILWVIFRQTYGWKKTKERISISYFQRKTGLDRRNIHRALKEMINRNIVVKNDNSYIVTYGFQKDYSKWKALSKLPVAKLSRGKNDNGFVVKNDTHKRKRKETINSGSKKTDPRIKIFIDWYFTMFEKKFKRKYAIPNGAKTGQQVKNILKSGLSFTDIQIAAMCFMLDDDEFLTGNEEKTGAGYDIGIFLTRMNKYDYVKERNNPKMIKWLIDEKGKLIRQPEGI